MGWGGGARDGVCSVCDDGTLSRGRPRTSHPNSGSPLPMPAHRSIGPHCRPMDGHACAAVPLDTARRYPPSSSSHRSAPLDRRTCAWLRELMPLARSVGRGLPARLFPFLGGMTAPCVACGWVGGGFRVRENRSRGGACHVQGTPCPLGLRSSPATIRSLVDRL